MNIQEALEKLQSSEPYTSLLKEHPDAYISAGFFVQDLEFGSSTYQIDLYIPSKDNVIAFTVAEQVTAKEMELMHNKIPEKLSLPPQIQLQDLKELIENEMKSKELTGTISKIIAVIQNIEGKITWHLNCVLSGLNILRATLLDESKEFQKIDKSSIMNFVKKG